MTLADAAPGVRVRVTAVGGDHAQALRLMELGLLPGTDVEFIRTAPLGDPLEFRVRGYSLSLRRAVAAAIEVEHVGGQAH